MKIQKIFITSGLTLIILVLAGCGENNISKESKKAIIPSAETTTAPTGVSADSAVVSLPETVSTQPGLTVETEINNIDKDLKSLDDVNLSQGLSDADLGL